METVYCPVVKGQVDGTTCLEIVIVTDREAKPSILPESIKWSEEMREICKACKYHDENKVAHTLDAPNAVAHKKLQIALRELGITEEDIE